MRTRIISGVTIAVICVALGLTGGILLGAVLFFCAMIGFHEMCRATGALTPGGIEAEAQDEGEPITVDRLKQRDKMNILEAAGFGMTAVYYAGLIFLNGRIDLNLFTLLCIVALVLILMAAYVFTFPKFHADQIMSTLFAFIYVPLLMSFVYRARCLTYGMYIYALVFFCTWICDSGAYFAGRFLGKHKMAPILSPKKTVEGAVGGMVSSAILCFILAVVMEQQNPADNLHIRAAFVIIGIIASFISMIGDLSASAIKRNHNIKDYGDFIPGHGGILDRFDSVIFTAPIIYFLAVLLLKSLNML